MLAHPAESTIQDRKAITMPTHDTNEPAECPLPKLPRHPLESLLLWASLLVITAVVTLFGTVIGILWVTYVR